MSLAAVLDSFTGGARTVDDLAERTGLGKDLVRVALDQLVALRLVDAAPLAGACPDDSCGGCPVATGCAGPVALTLSRPRG
ncbi:MAG TPA: hypothetical protein VFL59_04615 [Candidatus Nanopelagicales bacterium]|nr:hypothetical protein [Candidatus Nanopelagicales bacterium]